MVSISKLMWRVMGGERCAGGGNDVQEIENDVQEVGNDVRKVNSNV